MGAVSGETGVDAEVEEGVRDAGGGAMLQRMQAQTRACMRRWWNVSPAFRGGTYRLVLGCQEVRLTPP